MHKRQSVISLESGWSLPRTIKYYLTVVFCAGIVFLPFLINFAIVNGGDKFIIPILVVGLCILSFCILFVDYKEYNKYKKIKSDLVLLDAESKITDKYINPNLILRSARISVKFYYNGKLIVKRSGQEGYKDIFDGSKKAGYSSAFLKYGDRDIKILYSPSKDKVFIVKD